MIRLCKNSDLGIILDIINDSAEAYRGVIPKDRWQEPYMRNSYLKKEITEGVIFHGYYLSDDRLIGVMGVQEKRDVTLIRHAYVRTKYRREGIGSQLLNHVIKIVDKPLLVGTWKAANWAISFYEKQGFRVVGQIETKRLLRSYWSIPRRQVETSIVLADASWKYDSRNLTSNQAKTKLN